MEEVNIMRCFISIAAFPKTGKGFVTQRLLFVTCSMKGILITDIKHQAFYDVIIRKLEHLFYNEGTDTNVDRRIEFGLAPCGI